VPVSITYTWTIFTPDTGLPVISTTAINNDDLGCNPTSITPPVFTGLDDCEGTFTPVVTSAGPSNTGCAYTQTWTANYTDACLNAAVPVSITYTWTIDNGLPVISTTAIDNDDLGCNPTSITPPVFTGLDNCDGVFTPVVTSAGPTNNGCVYSQTWTANYTDACLNAAVPVSITYTWTINSGLPVISTTAIDNDDLGCNPTSITPPVFTGLDDCEGTFTPVVTSAGPSNTGCAYTQTWTANYTDACLNAAVPVSITYTWTIDTGLPVISTTAINNDDLGCNPTSITPPVFTGLDNCDGVFTPVVTSAGPSNTGCAYTQTWTANYTDACLNPAVPVSITYTWTIDTGLPVISTTAINNDDLGCNPTSITPPVFTGLDDCEGAFTPVVTSAGPSNTGCAYTQTWTANYTDACLNAAVPVSITYTWTIDNGLPVISTTAIDNDDLGCNPTSITPPVFTGLDNCDGVFTPVVTSAGPTNNGCVYTQTWTANYTDACLNAAVPVSITYTWTINTGLPVISTTAIDNDDLGCNPTSITPPVFTGLDDCEGTFTPVVTSAGPSNTGCAYTQTWTANYTDACLNAAVPVSITYTWTIDTGLPVISTTAINNDDLGCNPTSITPPVFTGLDNCDGVFTPVVTSAGSSNTGCAYTQTWTANYTDACLNPAVPVSITYTWTIDTGLPVISTTAINNDDLGCNPTSITPPVFTGLDDCEGAFTPVVTSAGPSNTGCAYTQTWTANYTDACLNAAVPVSITYTWTIDTGLPVISTTAIDNDDLGCNPTSITPPVFTGLDNCDGVFTPVVTSAGPSNTGCVYTQTWTANYTDACLNAAVPVSITYTWTIDTGLPVISTTAINNDDLGCNPTSITPPVFTGLDNCEGAFTPVVTSAGPSNTGCAYTQTWTANYTDACLNAAVPVSITYTWTIDTGLPVISTTAIDNDDLGCNPTSITPPVFTGLDNCDGVFTPVVTSAGPSNTGCVYTQTWTANYTDACLNAAVPVSITYTWTIDTGLPVISTTAINNDDLGCNPTSITPPVFTGLDNCEGAFTPVVTSAGPSNTGCAYTQTWTANYTDACLNAAVPVSITYTWTIDTGLPVISTTAIDNDDLGCNPTSITPPVFTGLDNCDGVFTPVVTSAGPSNTGCVYTQTWTANYTDACLNAAVPVSITYTWTIDTGLPVISTTAINNDDLGCNPTSITPPVFTGLDNCEGAFTPVVTSAGPSNTGCAYTQTWTANYTDACLNAAVPVSITYTWTIDTGLPVISTTAINNDDLGCNPTSITPPVFTGLDNCEGAFTPVVTSAGPTNNGCAYTQTWTANYTDACLNAAVPVSITYTWTIDTGLPVISTTAINNDDLGCNPTSITPPVFTGLDNCDGVFTPVVTSAGPSNTGCAYTQTWTANYTDACLNAAVPVSITYTWTIDTGLPVISTTAINNDDLGCNPTSITPPVFTGLDNCEGAFTPVVTSAGPTNNGCAYTQTWTANYTDACLNPAVPVSITYTWTIDTVDPELTCPDNIAVVCASSIPDAYVSYAEFIAASGDATDNCGVDISTFILVNEEVVGNTIIRTYGIEDYCDNFGTCEQTITITDLNVETYVYLDGAAINPNGVQTYTVPMRTSLNNPVTNVKVLPGQTYFSLIAGNVYTLPGQPYSGAPWFYNGNEGAAFNSNNNPNPGTAGYASTVVDWVLVSLRETDDGMPVCMKAALLHNDGLVQFLDGGFDCCDLDLTSAYYLVIEHRNHLIIMSPNAIPVVNGTLTFDFRHNQSYGNGQKLIIPGTPNKYAMYAGNGDQTQEIFSDTEISFDDDTYWGGQNGTVGKYRNGDFNLNGDANFNDRTTWEFNNGIITTVPR
jgi:hypothetical protein